MPTQVITSYWKLSRAPRYSVVFAIPLLILYELLAAMLSTPTGAGMRNGADVLLRSAFYGIAGPYAPLAFGVALIGASIWIVGRDLRRSGGPLRPGIFATMFAESAALAVAFGVVIGTITARLLTPFSIATSSAQPQEGIATRLMLSLGAGLYEELLFRVLLVTGLVLVARRVMRWGPTLANVFAVGLGALIFSAFHYVGPFGDPLRLDSFVFRAIAGVAFSALYVTRGFGITAWTHALYDVIVLVF
jgi:hypothetical protein